jgi:hypothetical protein
MHDSVTYSSLLTGLQGTMTVKQEDSSKNIDNLSCVVIAVCIDNTKLNESMNQRSHFIHRNGDKIRSIYYTECMADEILKKKMKQTRDNSI